MPIDYMHDAGTLATMKSVSDGVWVVCVCNS